MNKISDIITSYLKFCGENKLPFGLIKDGDKNYVQYIPNEKVTISIGNPDDKNLEKMLSEELENLLH